MRLHDPSTFCHACGGDGYHTQAVAVNDDSGDVEVDHFRCEACGGSGRATTHTPEIEEAA